MVIQWGKNPEYILSVCISCMWHNGEIALPFKLSWWNHVDGLGHRNVDVVITFLCFRFGLDIWRWNK